MKDDRPKPKRESSQRHPGSNRPGSKPTSPRKPDSSRAGSPPYKSGKPSNSRPGKPGESRRTSDSRSDKPRYDKPRSDRPRGDKPPFDKARSDRPRGDKPGFDKPRSDRSRGGNGPSERRPEGAPIRVQRPVMKRKKVGLPIRGRRPETPAWIGRLDHPFRVDLDRVKQLTELLQVSTDPAPFHQHLELVKAINEEVNLVSRASVDAVLLQSLWESLIPVAETDWRRGPRLLDLGTGGGFPGLPLALALPDTKTTLLDSRRAKTLSLQRMAAELGAKNISIVHDRAETHAERLDTPYDSVVVRAVSVLPEVAQWCENLLKPGGTLLSWKGPEGEREAKALDSSKWKLLYALPVLPHRYVLVLEKIDPESKQSDAIATETAPSE